MQDHQAGLEGARGFEDRVLLLRYESLVEEYKSGEVHPGDLKPSLSKAINSILQPVREHFENDAEAKALLKQVTGARRVIVFDHTLRAGDEGTRTRKVIRESVQMVHNDYTARSAARRPPLPGARVPAARALAAASPPSPALTQPAIAMSQTPSTASD